MTSAPVRMACPGFTAASPANAMMSTPSARYAAEARMRGTHCLRNASSAAIPTGWPGGHAAAGPVSLGELPVVVGVAEVVLELVFEVVLVVDVPPAALGLGLVTAVASAQAPGAMY